MSLPDSATITVKNQQPTPSGEVEVKPNGLIIFENLDNVDYRLRLRSTKDSSTTDRPLPANGQATVPIKQDDEFMYEIRKVDSSAAVLSAAAGTSTITPSTGTGGGPIKN